MHDYGGDDGLKVGDWGMGTSDWSATPHPLFFAPQAGRLQQYQILIMRRAEEYRLAGAEDDASF
ncbi:hypothetical protein GCM10022394_14630 [Zobellella aerophila]|uniref:Uncharacterized protein n=1 Tax=Zobellella aerophila TaxID=870480 RepID=A0ABP6VN54_9GAMM